MESGYKRLTAIHKAQLCHEFLSARSALLVFDYDGTLAPIRRDPARAFVPLPILAFLDGLSRLARIAIVSGRPYSELSRFVRTQRLMLFGEHGAEGPLGKSAMQRITNEVFDSWHPQILDQVCGLGLVASRVERKQFSVNVDCLVSLPTAGQLRELGRRLAHISPAPVVRVGRYGVDLGNGALPDKANTVSDLIDQYDADFVLYCGDDKPDESVYRLLQARRTTLTTWTFHLDRTGNTKGARFSLPGVGELSQLLAHLHRAATAAA